MRKQIRRFSPHQTAKVFAILMAIGFTPFFALSGLGFLFAPTPLDAQGNPVNFPYGMFVILPVVYLILGYISVAFGCWLYNVMYRFIGGIEFELEEK